MQHLNVIVIPCRDNYYFYSVNNVSSQTNDNMKIDSDVGLFKTKTQVSKASSPWVISQRLNQQPVPHSAQIDHLVFKHDRF